MRLRAGNWHRDIVLVGQAVAAHRRTYGAAAQSFADQADAAINADRRDNAERYSALRARTALVRQRAVAARPYNAVSLAYAARDYGLVPHGECIGHCTGQQRIQRNAAALVQFEYRHPWPGARTHLTAWATAR